MCKCVYARVRGMCSHVLVLRISFRCDQNVATARLIMLRGATYAVVDLRKATKVDKNMYVKRKAYMYVTEAESDKL